MEREAYNILIIRLDAVSGGAEAAAAAIASLLRVPDDVAARAVRAVPGVVPVEVDRTEAQAFVLALRDVGIEARAVAMARRATGRLTSVDGPVLPKPPEPEDWARSATSGVRSTVSGAPEHPAAGLRPATMDSGDWARVASSGMRTVSARRQSGTTGAQAAVPTPMSPLAVAGPPPLAESVPVPVGAAAYSVGGGAPPTPPARPGLSDSSPLAPAVGTAPAVDQHEMARLDEAVGQGDPFALDDLPELADLAARSSPPGAPPRGPQRREQPSETELHGPSPAPHLHTPVQRGDAESASAVPHSATAFAPAFRGADEQPVQRAPAPRWTDAEVEDAGWTREDSLPKQPTLSPREMMGSADGPASPSVLGTSAEAALPRLSPLEELASIDASEEFPPPPSVEDFFASIGNVPEPTDPEAAVAPVAAESPVPPARVGIPLSQLSEAVDGEASTRVGRAVVPAAPQLGVTHSSLEDELLEVSGLYSLDADRGTRRDRNTTGSVAVPVRATTRMQAIPAKKPLPVVAISVTLLVVLCLAVAGKLAWDAQQRQRPAWRFANAPLFLELAAQTQGAVTYWGCAHVDGAWLCRFDADFFRAVLPGISQAVSRHAARSCFARTSVAAGATTSALRCSFEAEGDTTATQLQFDWERACATPLADVPDQGVVACTVRGESRAVLAGGQIVTSEFRANQDWRHQADRQSAQTEGGHLPVREFVVTASGSPARTIWYAPALQLVVTTRTIGGLPNSPYDAEMQLTWRVDGSTEYGAPRQDWGR